MLTEDDVKRIVRDNLGVTCQTWTAGETATFDPGHDWPPASKLRCVPPALAGKIRAGYGGRAKQL